MKKFASNKGSQVLVDNNGNAKLKVSQKDWLKIGKQAGWFKKALFDDFDDAGGHDVPALEQGFGMDSTEHMRSKEDNLWEDYDNLRTMLNTAVGSEKENIQREIDTILGDIRGYQS